MRTQDITSLKNEVGKAWDSGHPDRGCSIIMDRFSDDIDDYLEDNQIVTKDFAIRRLEEDIHDDLDYIMDSSDMADFIITCARMIKELDKSRHVLWDDSECDNELTPLSKGQALKIVDNLSN